MRSVANKIELEQAFKNKEKEVIITNPKLFKKVQTCVKIKKWIPYIIGGIGVGAVALSNPFTAAPSALVLSTVAISTHTSIALIIAALSIIAIINKYDVEIEIELPNKIKIKYKNTDK